MKPPQFDEDISSIIDMLQPKHTTCLHLAKLRTFRKAKRLEADVVILVGLEDDIVPDPRAADPIEGARLYYVSMTRSKHNLYLFHSRRRPRNITFGAALMDKPRSRFLDVLGRDSDFIRA